MGRLERKEGNVPERRQSRLRRRRQEARTLLLSLKSVTKVVFSLLNYSLA